MARTTGTAKGNTDVAAIPTEDGHAVVGGRPGAGTMYRDLTSWGRPRPDDGTATAAPDPGPSLPGVHVSRQVVGREIQRLTAKVDGIERDLARGVIGASGQPVPHLVQAHADARAELVNLRAEIARLNSLTDLESRQFAADKGYQ